MSNGRSLNAEPQDVVICIAGISYSDKTKYRACAVMQYISCPSSRGISVRYLTVCDACRFGPNISVEPYIDEFLVSPKTAVKKLTQRIREELIKVTVNAPNW